MSSNTDHIKQRIVIIGSAGRLGSLLERALSEMHTVIGLTRNELDFKDQASIRAALEAVEYDKVIIAGALTGVDYCETHEEEAFAVNANGPGVIAELSTRKNAHVTYFSTDLVYDGHKTEPYRETDAADPISVYGASKLEGERRVLKSSSRNLVVRVSWLFGPGKPAFPEWIINKACAESMVTLPGNKVACPTSCGDLVESIMPLLFGPDETAASGIFNFCNSEPCTWREWGQFCIDTARAAGLPVLADQIQGVPVDSVPAFVAKRPVNSAMSTEKYTALTGVEPRPWQQAVSEFLLDSELFGTYSTSSTKA